MNNITYLHVNKEDKDKLVLISKQLAKIAEEYPATYSGIEIHIAIAHLCAAILKLNEEND